MQLSSVFLTDWYSETSHILKHEDMHTKPHEVRKAGSSALQILPSGPGYLDENNLKLFTAMIHKAQEEVVLVNPYFVPHDSLLTALTSVAQRGVKVKLINSEVMDQWMVGHAQRSYYEMLLNAGVEIYLYKAPILLHSKFIVVDSKIATVGSSNLDLRSFYLDLEVTLIAYDPKVAKQLHGVAETYLKRSNQLNVKKWRKRPYRTQLKDNIARLTAALQ
jgi:cardiolipin synthase